MAMAPPASLGVAATITVDGSELSSDLAPHLDQVVVDEDVSLPAMFAITFLDPARNLLDVGSLSVGSKVEVSVAGQGSDDGDPPLITGEIVTIECDYDEFGARVIARGYAPSHRLQRGRKSKVYSNVTDSDLVKQLVGDAGLELGEIQETSQVYDHVFQHNISDWDFLRLRASTIGFELTAVDDKINFGPPTNAADAPSDAGDDDSSDPSDPRILRYGRNLLAFHGRISGAEQVARVEVRGWDPVAKTEVVASAPAGTTAVALEHNDPASLAAAFGNQAFVSISDQPTTDGEANTAAKALADRIGSRFAKVDGLAIGNAKLRAGAAVRCTGVGQAFSGAYVLSVTRHVIDGFGYRTHFAIGGREAGAAPQAASPAPSPTPSGHRTMHVPGVVRALVADNADPENLGRVKLRFPWLDEDVKSDWAPVLQLGAGPKSGTLFLPAVDDEVLVAFEQGSVGHPIVVGGTFNGADKPPTYSQWLDNGSVTGRGIYSRKGHFVEFWDGDDKNMAVLSTSGAEASVAVDAGNQKVVIQSDGAIEITASAELKVHASKMTLEADGELVLKGAQIKLN